MPTKTRPDTSNKLIPKYQLYKHNHSRQCLIYTSQSPTIVGPKKSSRAKEEKKDFKLAIINMLNDLKGDTSKSIHKIYENSNKLWNEMKNTVQDIKVEI